MCLHVKERIKTSSAHLWQANILLLLVLTGLSLPQVIYIYKLYFISTSNHVALNYALSHSISVTLDLTGHCLHLNTLS